MSKGSKAVIEWRRRTKRRAVEYLGGRCIRCGYDRCVRALSFHHKNPSEKAFNISHPNTKRWEMIQRELDRCSLLCANCHMEIEDLLCSGPTGRAFRC